MLPKSGTFCVCAPFTPKETCPSRVRQATPLISMAITVFTLAVAQALNSLLRVPIRLSSLRSEPCSVISPGLSIKLFKTAGSGHP